MFTLGFFLGRTGRGPAVTISQSAPRETVLAAAVSVTEPDSPALININTAGKEELMELPGVGDVLAQRILDHRTEHGAFSKVTDLMLVDGIGQKTMEELLEYITTGG